MVVPGIKKRLLLMSLFLVIQKENYIKSVSIPIYIMLLLSSGFVFILDS